MNRPVVLCVDDELDNLEALERLFRNKFHVLKSTSPSAALELLSRHTEPVAVIITDQRMPGMSGVEFLEKSLRTHPDSVRMLLTGYSDVDAIVAAVNSGQIFRYLHKPWDPVDLVNTVEQAVQKFNLSSELAQKNKALEQALEELKSLDQAKNQFMILVNHELKTPLTSILSFTELLKESQMEEDQRLCVDRIYKSADKLKSIVDDVLLVVKSEMKLIKLKIHAFDCRSLLLSLPTEITQAIKQKNLVFKSDWIEKRIIADQDFVEQVLHRLIHNATKFAIENTEVSVNAELTMPHRVLIRVYNKGPKISQSVMDKIHRPFFLDEDVMNHSVGMGLGLTICHSILKLHNSSLHVVNKGEGVEVSFELPCL